MILVMVGTHHQPFLRLMASLEALPGEELFVQHGSSPAPRGVAEAKDFLPFPGLVARVEEADVVVTHAGVGSILLALRAGHTPVVVPRRRRHGEHVDDHQVELTRALTRQGSVLPVWEMDELAVSVARVPPRRPARTAVEGPLQLAVGRVLRGWAAVAV